jgi:hypothetical protein
MKLEFGAPTLQGLDVLDVDLLAVAVFQRDRPLPALAGLVDWRLNGQVSRVLGAGRFTGRLGESVLLPCGDRIGAGRFLLFGLGEDHAYTEGRFAEAAEWIWGIASRMLTTSVAMPFPGGHRSGISPRRSARLLVSAAGRAYGGDGARLALTLLVRPEHRREIQGGLEGDRAHHQIDFHEDRS